MRRRLEHPAAARPVPLELLEHAAVHLIGAAQIAGLNGGLTGGGLSLGDYDSDNDLDILISGSDSGNQKQLRVYSNNGNGTFNATPSEIDGLNGELAQVEKKMAGYLKELGL